MKFWALVSKFSETRFLPNGPRDPWGEGVRRGKRLDSTSRLVGPGQAIVKWYNTALSRPTTILRKGLASLLNFEPTTTSQDNFVFLVPFLLQVRFFSQARWSTQIFSIFFFLFQVSLFRTTHPIFCPFSWARLHPWYIIVSTHSPPHISPSSCPLYQLVPRPSTTASSRCATSFSGEP